MVAAGAARPSFTVPGHFEGPPDIHDHTRLVTVRELGGLLNRAAKGAVMMIHLGRLGDTDRKRAAVARTSLLKMLQEQSDTLSQ